MLTHLHNEYIICISKGAVSYNSWRLYFFLFKVFRGVCYVFPRVIIDIKKLSNNITVVNEYCSQHNIQITGITKMFCGDYKIAQVLIDNGIHILGDARIANLKKLVSLNAEKWLIRIPMISEAPEVIRYADVSFHSELRTLQAFNYEARKQKKNHKVILMADLGDIREGYVDYNQLIDAAKQVNKMDSLALYGIGTNLTCFSFVHPDTQKMKKLLEIKESICKDQNTVINFISGGNSATIDLMLHGGIPNGVNNLRLGEALLFGKERAHYHFLKGTYSDVFQLQAEIVELKEKPSVPWGKVGVDSYGRKPTFKDRGTRIRAICAVGKQDIDIETMEPLDTGINIVGASCDHLILDITDSKNNYEVGDIVAFKLGYFSAMRVFTSQYVEKVYTNSRVQSLTNTEMVHNCLGI